jgi:hypothetical protein
LHEEPNIILEAAKWGWLALVGVVVWMWQRMIGHVEKNSEELQDHIMDDLKTHDDFVKKSEWDAMKNSLYARFDKLDAKSDKILDRVVLGITREEFKGENQAIYQKLDDLQKNKADK